MNERIYSPLGTEHSITIGKTTFTVNSFADTNSNVTAEELIIGMLKSKVKDMSKEEKTA